MNKTIDSKIPSMSRRELLRGTLSVGAAALTAACGKTTVLDNSSGDVTVADDGSQVVINVYSGNWHARTTQYKFEHPSIAKSSDFDPAKATLVEVTVDPNWLPFNQETYVRNSGTIYGDIKPAQETDAYASLKNALPAIHNYAGPDRIRNPFKKWFGV